MNIETAKELQTQLEQTVSDLVSAFEIQTGLTVTNLYVYPRKSGQDGHVEAETVLRSNGEVK